MLGLHFRIYFNNFINNDVIVSESQSEVSFNNHF